GIVVAVVFTGEAMGDQWPGSRVIAAQKANTANDFSLTGLALSTANLYAATQPGGSLFGLQESNPVDPDVAYGGNPLNNGTVRDYMVGKRIGGINVFGGGVALYASDGTLLGGLGVSGDMSCADQHRLENALSVRPGPRAGGRQSSAGVRQHHLRSHGRRRRPSERQRLRASHVHRGY